MSDNKENGAAQVGGKRAAATAADTDGVAVAKKDAATAAVKSSTIKTAADDAAAAAAAAEQKAAAAAAATQSAMALDDNEFSPELLKVYYERVFPVSPMFKWLSYFNDPHDGSADQHFAKHREWSFTLKDDVYVRYKCFKTRDELKDALVRKVPHKIDIGAVYNAPPSMRQNVAHFKPEEKELVFDIDMTDYDAVRTCCSGASICTKCWPLMTAAINVVDSQLRDDFGFEHLLWIFSGRRGVHCWVCDPRALTLSQDARCAIVDYMSVQIKDKDHSQGAAGGKNDVVISMRSHPAMQRAFAQLEPAFRNIALLNHEILDTEQDERWCEVLDFIPDVTLRQQVHDKWTAMKGQDSDTVGLNRWKVLKEMVTSHAAKQKTPNSPQQAARLKALQTCITQMVFHRVYPRLDANVSKGLNHLLKSPFCVHPKTGKVCVPIDPRHPEDFDPDDVPTLGRLVNEINEIARDEKASKGSSSGRKQKVWEQTSLGPYIQFFNNNFCKPLERALQKTRQATKAETNAMQF